MGPRNESTLVVLLVLILTPLALPLAGVAIWRLRRRASPLLHRRWLDALLAVAAAYLVAYVAYLTLQVMNPRPVMGRLTGLFSLVDGCGLAPGARGWLTHLEDPGYAVCGTCDDAGLGEGYRPEFRQLYCPDR